MRIVSFGDIHMAIDRIEQLAAEMAAADVVILSGDLTTFGGQDDARRVLDATQRHAGSLLALPGNLDLPDVIHLLDDMTVSLHGCARRIGDVGIFGCGGSNRTPFATPTEFGEEELDYLLRRGHTQIADAARRVMVCHAPPIESTTDRLFNGQHVGSPAVRAFIEQFQPDVCITGHIHESAGIDHIGRTTVLNPGALRDGGYVVVTVSPHGVDATMRIA